MGIKLTDKKAEHLRQVAFRVSCKVLRSEQNAFDIAQETVKRLLEAKIMPQSPAAWCTTTALRLSLNLVRDRTNRLRILDQHAAALEPASENAEQRVQLIELIESASERAAMALWCRFVNGMSSKETAELLNVSERTVRDDLAKLREDWKRRLEEDE